MSRPSRRRKAVTRRRARAAFKRHREDPRWFARELWLEGMAEDLYPLRISPGPGVVVLGSGGSVMHDSVQPAVGPIGYVKRKERPRAEEEDRPA